MCVCVRAHVFCVVADLEAGLQDAYGSFGPEMMSSQGTGGMEVAPVTAPPPPTDTTDDNGQAQADAS